GCGPGPGCGYRGADGDRGAGRTGPAAACAWPGPRCRRIPRYRRLYRNALTLLFSSEKRAGGFCSITTRIQASVTAGPFILVASSLLASIAVQRSARREHSAAMYRTDDHVERQHGLRMRPT